jgi:predicted SPOUT superfamily RNA methylase MTH1
LEKFVSLTGDKRVGHRVTIRLVGIGTDLRGELLEHADSSASGRTEYWGYRVHEAESLGKLLRDERWDLKVGTSRYGVPIQDVLPSVSKDMNTAKSTVVAFGSPKTGLREILAAEKLTPNVFRYFVNMFPDQQTMTVRTEEAILGSLAILKLAEKIGC